MVIAIALLRVYSFSNCVVYLLCVILIYLVDWVINLNEVLHTSIWVTPMLIFRDLYVKWICTLEYCFLYPVPCNFFFEFYLLNFMILIGHSHFL